MTRPNFLMLAADMLERAGHPVTPVGDIPGLWNVNGIGSDLTTGQVLDVAGRFGVPMPFTPAFKLMTIVPA